VTPLALTDAQLTLVQRASALLSPRRRDNFLRSIASRLDGAAHPSDAELEGAVNFVLSVSGVSVGFLFCNQRGGHCAPTKANA
jgi:hypothetical protein